MSMQQLASIRNATRGSIVYARGVFDLLHPGHIEFIEFAKQQGDALVVGLIADAVVAHNKGKNRPIQNQTDRLRLVNAIKGVDHAFIVPPPTPHQTKTEIVIEALKPDVFILFDEKEAQTQHFKKLLEQYNIKLVLDTSAKAGSTTQLIEKIQRA